MEDKLQKLIQIEKTPVICKCNYIPPTIKLDLFLCKQLGIPVRSKEHNVKEGHHSIRCTECGKTWCCGECAIEDDAIPGFLDQYKEFPRQKDAKYPNMRFVKCLKCQKRE